MFIRTKTKGEVKDSAYAVHCTNEKRQITQKIRTDKGGEIQRNSRQTAESLFLLHIKKKKKCSK